MYNMPSWKDPGRRRRISLDHNDKDYCWYYDLDDADFTKLVMKLKSGQRLNETDNDRYGKYIYTIIYIAMSNPKFVNKSSDERNGMFEQAVMELLKGLTTFNPQKGRLYSFAYRICFTSFCHYFTEKIKDAEERKANEEHCRQELEDYYYEWSDHKIRNINMKETR